MHQVLEWLSDYLRYILLGLILIALAVLCFGLVRRIGENRADRADSSAHTASESAKDASPEEKEADDEAAATALLNKYFSALALQNTDALAECVDTLSEAEISSVKNGVPTQYHDISVMVKPGPDADSLAALASFSYEQLGSTGSVRDLRSFLLRKNDEGNYVIRNSALTASEQTFMNELSSDPDVAALIEQVRNERSAALTPTPTPAPTPRPTAVPQGNRVTRDDTQSEETEDTGDTEEDDETAQEEEDDYNPFSVGDEYTVNTDCNLRDDASYDADVIGTLEEGMTVIVTGYEDGWVGVDTDLGSGYMGGDFLS